MGHSPINIYAVKLTNLPLGVATVLGAADLTFKSIVFFGARGTSKSPNSGVVHVHLRDRVTGEFGPSFPVKPDQFGPTFFAEQNAVGLLDAAQFKAEPTVASDGLIGIITV